MSQLYSKDFPPPKQPLAPPSGPSTGTAETPAPPVPGAQIPNDFFASDPTGVYHGVGISVTYSWDFGLRYAAVAAPKGSANAVFWRIHTGVCLKTVSWVMQRLGTTPPVPPNINTGTDNEVPLSQAISVSDPMDFPDGSQGLTVVGQYVYGLQKAPANTDPILVPHSNIRLNASTQLIPADFTSVLIGPVTPPAGFSGGPINF